jgi:hypothetical protein
MCDVCIAIARWVHRTPADGGQADTPTGGGKAGTPAGAIPCGGRGLQKEPQKRRGREGVSTQVLHANNSGKALLLLPCLYT